MNTSSWANTPPPTRVDAVAQVQALAKAMYPSLAAQNLRARILSELYFDTEPLPLGPFRYSILPGTDADPQDLLVIDVYRVDDHGRLDACSVTGEFVNTARHAKLREDLEAHKDWSELQDTEALREAGAQFGPWNRAGFLAQTLPRLQALGPTWGRMATWTADFEMRYRDGDQAAPILAWRMVVALRSDRGTQRYRLTFEPFQGKLIFMRHW